MRLAVAYRDVDILCVRPVDAMIEGRGTARRLSVTLAMGILSACAVRPVSAFVWESVFVVGYCIFAWWLISGALNEAQTH